MNEQYYVRIRGRTQGPFGLEKLQTLVRRGQLGRIHEISLDGTNWQSAAKVPKLFEGSDTLAKPEQQRPSGPPTADQPAQPKVETPSPEPPVWYYARGDEEFGPVEFPTLRLKVATGELTVEDQVWTQGMANWTVAKSIPGLFPEATRSGSSGDSYLSEGDSANSGGVSRDIARTLAESRPWVLFLAICGFIVATGWIAFGIVLIIRGAQAHEGVIVSTGLLTFLFAGVSLAAGAYMSVLQSRIGSFARSRSQGRLESIVRVLRSFWIFVSIVLVVLLVFGALFAIFYFGEINVL